MNFHSTFDFSDFPALIESQWHDSRVLIVGDVMLDKYAFGKVERISPEAPVPVVRGVHSCERPGGAANVAMNVARLGGTAILAGFVGDDGDANMLKSLIEQEGIRSLFVNIPGKPTTSKLRIVGGQQQIVRLDFESSETLQPEAYTQLLAIVESVLKDVTAVVLSDYAKGVLSKEVCERVITLAREHSIPVLVDPKSRDFDRYRGATTICPNLAELSLAIGIPVNDTDALLEQGQQLVKRLDLDYLTVTLSELGIAILENNRRQVAPAVARQVFDVSGAGDTVIAVLALCSACSVSPLHAIELANLGAGIVVGKVGTEPVTKVELLAEINAFVAEPFEHKIMELPSLMAAGERWRNAGESIVFTNGCFDILHVGHVTLLERSKLLGTRLVVGINSDASVSRLKGPSRPIIGQQDRARLLSALSSTDGVIIFEEDTPLAIIQALQPAVLVKGGDYTEASVVGAEDVKRYGGRVALVPLVPGFSTSSVINKLSGTTLNQELSSSNMGSTNGIHALSEDQKVIDELHRFSSETEI